jgi:threonine synthase
MTALTGLQCHVCRAPFPAEALFVCDKCFGPLEAVYDYEVAARTMTRAAIETRPRNLWR